MGEFTPAEDLIGRTVIFLDEEGQPTGEGKLTAIHGPFLYEVDGKNWEVGQTTDFAEAEDPENIGKLYLWCAY